MTPRDWTQALATTVPPDASARGSATFVLLVVLVLLGSLFLAVLAVSLRRMRRLRESNRREPDAESHIDPWRESARRMRLPPQEAED
jgi:hypothetical protein